MDVLPRFRDAATKVFGISLMHIHSILGFAAKNINEDVAVSHHYRICEFGGFDCLKLPSKTDRVAHRWAKSLFTRVKKACDMTFGRDNGCPKAPPLGSPW